MGQFDQAIADFTEALRLEPGDPKPLLAAQGWPTPAPATWNRLWPTTRRRSTGPAVRHRLFLPGSRLRRSGQPRPDHRRSDHGFAPGLDPSGNLIFAGGRLPIRKNTIGPWPISAKPCGEIRRTPKPGTSGPAARPPGGFDQAVADYTEVLRIAPQAAWAYPTAPLCTTHATSSNRPSGTSPRPLAWPPAIRPVQQPRPLPGPTRLVLGGSGRLRRGGPPGPRQPTLVFQPGHPRYRLEDSREPLPTSRRCCRARRPTLPSSTNEPRPIMPTATRLTIADHRQALQVDPDDVTACNSLACFWPPTQTIRSATVRKRWCMPARRAR